MTNPLIFSAALLAMALNAHSQTVTATRAAELRADKLANAAVVGTVSSGAALRLVSLEGGWALVDNQGQTGWIRAGAVDLKAGASAAAGMNTGRQASGNTAMTLGVRSLPPRINRHALIIGISRYADTNTPPLPGARVDRESATQMATAMQVPASNIKYLQDDQATGDNIRSAIRELTDRVQDGDRVFIHYSGHGTRYNDPSAGGCIEALLAYDGGQSGTITNREMADLLRSITGKTDKLFVMYDACHSGGLVRDAVPLRSRGIANGNDEGLLRPKFASITEECGRPVNVKTRNLVVEQVSKGALPQDIIHVSAARDNEISFDDELKGGLATQFMRDCMLRDAKDLDGSGAVSVDEIKVCAQEKINKRMQNDPNYKAHNILLSGNSGFVPSWFSQALPVVQVASLAPVALPSASPVPSLPVTQPPKPAVTPTTVASAPAVAPAQDAVKPPAKPAASAAQATRPPGTASASAGSSGGLTPVKPEVMAIAPVAQPPSVVASPPQLTGEQALRQMFDQRDAKRRVQVSLSKDRLKIGQDSLDFTVQSERGGYVYVALAGSDSKSMYLLFPNDLDQNNKIEAGQTLTLPHANWRVKAGGPAGLDSLLVMVADGPRDVAPLAASKAGPFVSSLNDADGRAKLGALMTTSRLVTSQECTVNRKNNSLCSDAYGAALVTVEEVK